MSDEYKFLINVNKDWITQENINDFHRGAYGIICVSDADEDTIESFGALIDQDMYGRKKVTIGIAKAWIAKELEMKRRV